MRTVRITETSKQALCLLFSVILLTGTVIGVFLPLRETAEELQGRIQLMEQERLRYEAFASAPRSQERQRQNKARLLHLQRRIPLKPEDAAMVGSIYDLARRNRVSVVKLRRKTEEASSLGAKSSQGAGKGKNKVGVADLPNTGLARCDWETEFSGTYFALLEFLQRLESTGAMVRLSGAVIRLSDKEDGSVRIQGILTLFCRSVSAETLPRTNK